MKNLYKFSLACLFVLVGIFPLAHTVHAVIDYHAYVANTTNSTVSVIDKVSNSVIATVPVGDTPTDVKAYPPNHRVYVANNAGQSISVIDTNTNTVVTTIPLGTGSPFGLALSNDGSRLYATGGGDDNVYVIDTATNTVIATLTGFDVPYNLTVILQERDYMLLTTYMIQAAF